MDHTDALRQMAEDLADEIRYPLEQLILMGETEDAHLKGLEKMVDVYKAEIKKRIEALGLQTGQSILPEGLGGKGVLYSARTTPKTLDRELLVLEGIGADVLDRCTTGGEPGKPFVQFVRPRENRAR